MLRDYERGYAVMDKDLSAYSFECVDLETCKRYCRDGSVIVEKIPYVCGFSLRVWVSRFNHGLKYDKYSRRLSLWRLQIQTGKEYEHKNGKIVYTAPEE